MIELSLITTLFFLLISVMASYLLKASLKKDGIAESVIEKTILIAIGLPPMSSANVKLLIPGGLPQQSPSISSLGKWYLLIVRASFYLAVISLIAGVINEL